MHPQNSGAGRNAERRTQTAERRPGTRLPNPGPRFPVRDPRAPIRDPRSAIRDPRSAILYHPPHVDRRHVCHARDLAAAAPVRLSSIELRLIKLTLVRPFETSFGRMDAHIVPLVRMVADGVEGWGEIVADHEPLFSAETIATAQHVLADCFIPAC